MTIQVRVSCIGGTVCTVSACRSWTLRDVKIVVQAATGISLHEQRLLSGTFEPRDEDPLSRLPSGDFADVTLVRRPVEQARWMEEVELDGMQLRFAPPRLRQDREVVLAAVRQDARAFVFAAEELRGDVEIVRVATRNCAAVLRYVSANLPRDRNFVL